MNVTLPVASDATLSKCDFPQVIEALAKETTSHMGRELALALRPSASPALVEERQSETSEALALLTEAPDVPYGGIVDLREVLRHLRIGGQLEPVDFLQLLSQLYATRRWVDYLLVQKHEVPLEVLPAKAKALKVFDVLEKDIKKKIDDEGELRDGASDKLLHLRRDMRGLHREIRTQVERLLRNDGLQPYFQDQIMTMRNGRFVVAVKQEYRQRVPGVVHDQSASGATLYIEPEATVAKNHRLQDLEVQERAEAKRILEELSVLVRPYVRDLTRNMELLAEFDLFFAKAKYAERLQAIRPLPGEEATFDFNKARHPLLDPETVVPLSLGLNAKRHGIIISGPNTGGKTVTLKTAGLLILMHQAGLHLPLEEPSSIGIFRHVFADIGDEQSIEQSLSTFSAHMKNIVTILDAMNERSLVLFDELGAGTDPSEGTALAIAILEAVLDAGAKVLATTHYSDLKTFAYEHRGVENASVEFDIASLRPTYRLLVGVAGNSNAYDIARRIGLDGALVDRARTISEEKASQTEHVMRELEERQQEVISLRASLERAQEDLAMREAALAEETEALSAMEADIIERAQRQAANILSEARREADASVQELRALRKSRTNDSPERARAIQRQLSKKAGALRKEERPRGADLSAKSIRVGQEVYLNKFAQVATVIEKPDKNNNVLVQSGIMKISVPLAELSPHQSEQISVKRVARSGKGLNVKAFSPELDLRGRYLDEALTAVDKYLDDAFLSGINEVSLIHGKGTGSLRKGIRDALKTHPHVKEYRSGGLSEGGDGVTVVTIK